QKLSLIREPWEEIIRSPIPHPHTTHSVKGRRCSGAHFPTQRCTTPPQLHDKLSYTLPKAYSYVQKQASLRRLLFAASSIIQTSTDGSLAHSIYSSKAPLK